MNANDVAKVEALRDKWSDWAFFMQDLYGQDNPVSVAIRKCIADAYTLLPQPESTFELGKRPAQVKES